MHKAQSTAAPAPFSLCTPQTNPLLQQAPRIPPEKPSVPMVSEKFMSSKGPTCSLTPFKEIQSNSGGILICSGIFLGKPQFLEACLKESQHFPPKIIQLKIRECICATSISLSEVKETNVWPAPNLSREPANKEVSIFVRISSQSHERATAAAT